MIDTTPASGKPALVTQSDERPTGDQEIAGSISTRSGNIHSRKLIIILPWLLNQEGQLSVTGESSYTNTG